GISVQRIQVVQGNQFGQQNAVDVVDASDPTKTGNFITRFLLPGQPNDLAIGEGVAFVADGAAGLQVVNYEPFDTKGIKPTLTLTQLPADQDPNTPGIQVAEGQRVTLGATIRDDVQVRNVEVLVNGVAAANSVAYPFDLSAPLPTIAANGSNQVTLQIEAFDTGGNVALSDPVRVTPLAATTRPALVSQSVPDGAVKSQNLRTLVLQFSKPLDPATVTAANFALLSPTGAVLPQSIQTRDNGAV